MDVASEFGRVIGPLRRAVLRSRLAEDLPDLPEAQIELLRALQAAGTATPGELAAQLRVARSTISNLVRTMTAAGLVQRTPSSSDFRLVQLSLSPLSRDMLERYDRISTAALQRAIDSLTTQDRVALERAVPALHALLTALDRGQARQRTNRPA
ncbi:MarR family winged helix-turn-helix transcriptional regulator [Mycobacterium sp. 1423905.2]|uniref:MarR family winged helix-turn-helix transcriptional regulator n=1 Tax=Mycobacterium sp. 1423905.2 TaxID=1856859 RepID=UPI0007FCAC20|nr:MarR family transcriptional regulator [Mycobacterium sp. 1423905.2]OBJ52374.1 ArsR family transcriptional regulator [Mycobacterium sp. 1423905.2]